MILDEIEVKERLESPDNLMHRLKNLTNNHRPSAGITHPSLPPKSEDIIEDLEDKLSFGSIKSKAAGIMIQALDELKFRIPEVQRPEKLAQIAAEMGKVVNAQNENNKNDKPNNQFVMYAPTFVNEEHYETIHARE